jgi:TRAP-type mannitol/chloroaromatic compound transport system permease small subunit
MRKLLNYVRTLRQKEDGLVTAEWVVLTAIILIAGLAVVRQLFDSGVNTLTEAMDEEMEAAADEVLATDPLEGQ